MPLSLCCTYLEKEFTVIVAGAMTAPSNLARTDQPPTAPSMNFALGLFLRVVHQNSPTRGGKFRCFHLTMQGQSLGLPIEPFNGPRRVVPQHRAGCY
jgi:hypothetical protein